MIGRALGRTDVHSWRTPDGPELLRVPLDPRGQPRAAVQPGLLSNEVPSLCQPPKASCSPAGGPGQLLTVHVVEEPSHSSWGASGWPGGQGQGQQWTKGRTQMGLGLSPHLGVWVGG